MLQILHDLGHSDVLRLKPKSHYLAHVIYVELAKVPAVNPWCGATWRDEDFIGKIVRMVKACHARTVQDRCMNLHLGRLSHLLN